MSIHGRVTGVREQKLGDDVAVAAVLGATVIQVYDVADFDEAGGTVLIHYGGVTGDLVRNYVTCDDDASTVTLAAGATAAMAVDTRIDVWDAANAQPASTYLAVVDSVDGFDGTPVEATVDQGLVHAMSQFMRDGGTGESVTLERDGSELKVTAVHGRKFSLASMQYLQGGMTTRQADTDAGVDILGADSGTPGILAYKTGGGQTVVVDALTGNASFIGEIGTALPGDQGVFLYSLNFGKFGSIVTHPVVQLNTGASRTQPSIQANLDATGSGLWMFSGAGNAEKESRFVADNGHLSAFVETTPGSSVPGGYWSLTNDAIWHKTSYQYGAANVAGQVWADTTSAFFGYRDSGFANARGVVIARAGGINLQSSSGIQIVTVDAAAYQDLSAANVYSNGVLLTSEAALKTDVVEPPDALAIIRKAPAKQWRYKTDPKAKRRFGPVADDLPAYMGEKLPADHLHHPGAKTLDLARMNGLLWHAVNQLAAQVSDLTTRLDRLEKEK